MWTDRQAGGRRAMTKPIVAFRNFANAPKVASASDSVASLSLYDYMRA
jgi:hypothetical protein